jgi:RNA polymerase sigma-70 factor (ECF subfamily)
VLAARLIAGDRDALAEAYDQYSGLVYGLARRVVGDAGGAQDVTQAVFTALWEQPGRFDPDRGALRAYLGVLTHRRAVDWLRGEAAARRRIERGATVAAPSMPDVAEAAAAVLVAERVRAAVAELPPDQRDAIELAYFGGMTYRGVATSLGIPEGTAKSRLRLALARLAQVLQAEGATA